MSCRDRLHMTPHHKVPDVRETTKKQTFMVGVSLGDDMDVKHDDHQTQTPGERTA